MSSRWVSRPWGGSEGVVLSSLGPRGEPGQLEQGQLSWDFVQGAGLAPEVLLGARGHCPPGKEWGPSA